MKKIKEYINNKPKLKKTIKVFSILLFILSIGFNILIISVASCSNTNVKQDVTHNEVVATTPIKRNVLDFTTSTGEILYLVNGADLFNTDVLLGIVEYYKMYYVNEGGFDPYSTSTQTKTLSLSMRTYLHIPSTDINTLLINNTLYNTPFNSISNNQDRYGDIITFKWSYTPNLQYWRIELDLSTNGYTKQVLWSYIRGQLECPTINHVNMFGVTYIYQGSDNPFYYITHYHPSNDNYFSDGYNVGYNEGYQVGFSEGNVSVSSPFNLISNAFSSIASILNIQIIPNLTIGILLFAPLVVVLIIAIFKLFRG